MFTLANLLTLVDILNGLGGAGVAITKLRDYLVTQHHPSDPLPPEHVAAVQDALNDWALQRVVVRSQSALRTNAGILRDVANKLDLSANALEAP